MAAGTNAEYQRLAVFKVLRRNGGLVVIFRRIEMGFATDDRNGRKDNGRYDYVSFFHYKRIYL